MPSSLSCINQQALYPKVGGGYNLNHNQYTKNEQLFVPYFVEGTEYYFVDYHDKDACRWVRTPSQTFEGVGKIINHIHKNDIEVEDFRVLPEAFLSQLQQGDWCEEHNAYKLDTITNRVYLFGEREERFAEIFFSKETLSKGSEETKEEWIERITELKEKGDNRLENTTLVF